MTHAQTKEKKKRKNILNALGANEVLVHGDGCVLCTQKKLLYCSQMCTRSRSSLITFAFSTHFFVVVSSEKFSLALI